MVTTSLLGPGEPRCKHGQQVLVPQQCVPGSLVPHYPPQPVSLSEMGTAPKKTSRTIQHGQNGSRMFLGWGDPTEPQPCQKVRRARRRHRIWGGTRGNGNVCVTHCLPWPGSHPPPAHVNPSQPGQSHQRQSWGPREAQFGGKSCFLQQFTERSDIYPSPFGGGGAGRRGRARPSWLGRGGVIWCCN